MGAFLMDNNTSITVSKSNSCNLQAQTIHINADAIFISQESSLDASSLGDIAGPGKGDDTNGASYGGSGGRFSEDYFSYASNQSEVIGNPFCE